MAFDVNDRSYLKRALLGGQRLDLMPWRIRRQMMRWAGLEIAADAFFEAGVEIVAGKLDVAGGVYVNRGCLFDARGGIEIGAGTLIGPRVVILTATHPVMPSRPRAGPATYEPTCVGKDAWIGAGALLLPGSVVGNGCVVAAGAVVRGGGWKTMRYTQVSQRLGGELFSLGHSKPARCWPNKRARFPA